jgi:hypothetical protein
MVDEDPKSNKSTYEKQLQFLKEENRVKHFKDEMGNTVIVLAEKLEDWIIWVCKCNKIDLEAFGLPKVPNELHSVIN